MVDRSTDARIAELEGLLAHAHLFLFGVGRGQVSVSYEPGADPGRPWVVRGPSGRERHSGRGVAVARAQELEGSNSRAARSRPTAK